MDQRRRRLGMQPLQPASTEIAALNPSQNDESIDAARRGVQATVGLSISVSVNVENTPKSSLFDGLLRCLEGGHSEATCSDPTKFTLVAIKVPFGQGSRRLSASQSPTWARNLQGAGVCAQGTRVSCTDGVPLCCSHTISCYTRLWRENKYWRGPRTRKAQITQRVLNKHCPRPR